MAKLTCNPERMNVERLGAWMFVVAGGLFWTIAAFSGPYSFIKVDLTAAVGSALIPLALTVVVFLLGLWSELATAALLYGISLGGIAWGMTVGWEPALWALMIVVFVLPMMFAGTLYYLAWRMETACGGARQAMSLLEP